MNKLPKNIKCRTCNVLLPITNFNNKYINVKCHFCNVRRFYNIEINNSIKFYDYKIECYNENSSGTTYNLKYYVNELNYYEINSLDITNDTIIHYYHKEKPENYYIQEYIDIITPTIKLENIKDFIEKYHSNLIFR